jgi:hypothetical protein
MPVDEPLSPLDLALGVTGRAVEVATAAARTATAMVKATAPVFEPFVQASSHLPEQWRPERWLGRVNREGAAYRRAVPSALAALMDVIVPTVLSEVLSRAHLTDLVLRFVDLDRIVAAVDLDQAVAKVDVNQVVAMVDLDAAVHRVDIDSIVAQVDLEAIIDRVDVDAVASRLDVNVVLDRMDLTNVVLTRVDLDALVQAILAKMDLIGLAEEIIDGVDLSEIIRESTGTMASDTVQGVRMQGIWADDAVSHAMDRLLLRRRRRSTDAPGEPQSEAAESPDRSSSDVTGLPSGEPPVRP